MMRPHCDRCDALCDECQTWVEDFEHTEVCRNALSVSGAPLCICPTSVSRIWHIVIHAGGQVPCEEKMFCRACRISILEAYIKSLKLTKGEGGHLADCKWDANYKRYVCADGCEIKRINETPRV